MAKTTTTDTEKTSTAPAAEESGLLFAAFIEEDGEGTTTITFHDEKFTIPTFRADWPTKAMQAMQRGQLVNAVELIFGHEQWDRFNDLFPKLSDFWEFFPIFAEATGFVKLGDAAKTAEADAAETLTEG